MTNIKKIKLILVMCLYCFSIQSHAFSLLGASIGLVVTPKNNIRKSKYLVNNANLFFANSPVLYEAIPIVFLRFLNIFINKDGGGFVLYHAKHFKFRALITIDGEGYKGTNIEERKNTYFSGAFLEIYFLQLKFLQDMEHKSNGHTLRADFVKTFYLNHGKIEPHFAVQYWDKNYVNYYFGEKANESINNIAYNPKSSINQLYELRIFLNDGPFTYLMVPLYKHYGQEVANSPTLVRKDEWRITFGILYKLY